MGPRIFLPKNAAEQYTEGEGEENLVIVWVFLCHKTAIESKFFMCSKLNQVCVWSIGVQLQHLPVPISAMFHHNPGFSTLAVGS